MYMCVDHIAVASYLARGQDSFRSWLFLKYIGISVTVNYKSLSEAINRYSQLFY